MKPRNIKRRNSILMPENRARFHIIRFYQIRNGIFGVPKCWHRKLFWPYCWTESKYTGTNR